MSAITGSLAEVRAMIDREYGIVHPFNVDEFTAQSVLRLKAAMDAVRRET